MQFERNLQGNLNPLPKPSVDTGMGLERITSVMQETNDNYETDLFKSLIKKIAIELGEDDLKNPSLRVIADHLRSSTYLIADGLSISNEGRGYVLRRIVRRALRHAYKINPDIEHPLSKLTHDLIDQMKEVHGNLEVKKLDIEKALESEENQFSLTLRNGMRIFDEEVSSKTKIISGDLAFKLYDTYGFPLDMTIDLARERNLKVDEKGYDHQMDKQ